MDHAPGPIIAAVPPNVARIIEIHGSPVSRDREPHFDHGDQYSRDWGAEANEEQ